MAILRLVEGATEQRTFRLKVTNTVIGRHSSCDVQVADNSVSGEHARIVCRHDKFFVEDLGSKNGTLLNSNVANGLCELHDADEIQICAYKFLVGLFESTTSTDRPQSDTHMTGDADEATAIKPGVRDPQSIFDESDHDLNVVARLGAGSDSSTTRLASNPQAKLSAVLELSRNIFKVLTVEESTARILDAAFKTFSQTDEGAVILCDPVTHELTVSAVRPSYEDATLVTAFSATVARTAISSAEAVLIIDADDDSRFNMVDSLKALETKSMMCAPLMDQSGATIGAVQIFSTNSARRYSTVELDVLVSLASQASLSIQNVRLHETVRQLNAKLSHAARVSTVGEMVSGITHELHQPLAVIANYASGCQRRAQQQSLESDQLIQSLQAITAEALRAGEIMRSIREFLKKQDSKREHVDLNSIVNDAVKLAKMGQLDQKVLISKVLKRNLPPINVNRIQITQVILNLLMNAVEAMSESNKEKGVITIKTKKCDEDFAEVAVMDTGPGIAETNKVSIFEHFYTTKSEGLGIGLSMSKSIIEVHGGTIDFESKRGIGTTFRCTLPLVPHDDPATQKADCTSV